MSNRQIIIHTTCPPSLNNAFGNRADGKGRYRKANANQWIKKVLEDIRDQRIGILEGPFRFLILTERSHHARDVDNIIKLSLDAMQKASVILNDNMCWDARSLWIPNKELAPVKGDKCTIVLESITWPSAILDGPMSAKGVTESLIAEWSRLA